jgi:hypothetical protein
VYLSTKKHLLAKISSAFILICSSVFAQAQKTAKFTSNTNNSFTSAASFIENKGQYGTTYKEQENMGGILYGFEEDVSQPKRGILFFMDFILS